jgi:hypothetical protein
MPMRRLVLLTLFLLAAVVAAAPVRSARRRSVPTRVFPDTRARIRVFADQLPARMSDAQWRFAATHYVGSQKAVRSWTRRMRRLNPSFLMLHYQLAVGTGPAAFVEGEEWTNDFHTVTQNESWFMHDDREHRLHQPAWDWDLMDLRFAGGRPRTGFPAYWLASALRRMRANENDGCFADSYTQDILMNQLQPSTRLFSDVETNKRSWLPHLNAYGAWCAAAFHREPERFYYLPNLGGLVTTWDTVTDLAVGDGGMNEGFAAPEPGKSYSDEDWKLQMSRVLELAARRKIVLCQTGIDPERLDHRWFVVGSYLLTKGHRSYLNMFEKSSLEWYPEYTLDLGPYLAEPGAREPARPGAGTREPPRRRGERGGDEGCRAGEEGRPDVTAYWRADWKLFRRDYVRGIVLVNPTGSRVTVPELGQTYHLVTARGGGAVGGDGQAPGSLATRPVTSVTVPGHSARILMRAALAYE